MVMPHRCARLGLPWPLLFAVVVIATFASSAAAAIADAAGGNAPPPGDADSSSAANTATCSGFDDLVSWVRQNGGRVDSSLGLGMHTHGDDGYEIRGGVALADIPAGTELLFLPWKLVLGTEGDTANVPTDRCAVLRSYAAEIEAGESGFWHAYLSMDGSLRNEGARVPAAWDASILAELQGLPPAEKETSSNLVDWFVANCADGVPFDKLDEPTRRSLVAAVTRSAGMRFLPIFDLFNHHNGLLNTLSNADERGNTVTALKDIPKGDELFLSYRGGTGSNTAEIYRRYGFVEPRPQQWTWADAETAVEVTFLLLPGGTVAVHPPESMTAGIGTAAPPPLREMRNDANRHNSNLSAESLGRFEQAGRVLMSSLPTTVAEDMKILVGLNRERSVLESRRTLGEREALRLGDVISAVAYRMKFKEAVQAAVDAAGSVLKERTSAGAGDL